jgi:SHS2 domain-containing protein
MNFYKVLEHPADLKLKIFGRDLPELFCNLVKAIAQETKSEKLEVRNREWEDVEIESPDLFSLFVDFANEIVSRSDESGKIYTDCEIPEISETKLRAKISGIKADKKLDIKAATYHEGYVKKIDNRWEAVILFDI